MNLQKKKIISTSLPTQYRYWASGFTLFELLLTISISSVLVLALSVFMMDTRQSWSDCYAKIHGGAIDDALVAKAAFDSIVRKSSDTTHQFNSPDELTVYYYADWDNSSELDQLARFYRSATDPSKFYVEHANANGGSVLSTVLLCSHVTDLQFFEIENGYTMNLALDDGREQITVVSTALFHN